MFQIVLFIEEIDDAGSLLGDPKYCTITTNESETVIRRKFSQIIAATVERESSETVPEKVTSEQTVPVKRKLLYDLIHHLKASEQLASIAICATPTGPDRNRMTEVNINRMRALEALRELLKPCTKCSEDATQCTM